MTLASHVQYQCRSCQTAGHYNTLRSTYSSSQQQIQNNYRTERILNMKKFLYLNMLFVLTVFVSALAEKQPEPISMERDGPRLDLIFIRVIWSNRNLPIGLMEKNIHLLPPFLAGNLRKY